MEPKKTTDNKPKSKRLSLYPLKLDDALRAALNTPLPGKQPRAQAKGQK
jgi:hypothetical protein